MHTDYYTHNLSWMRNEVRLNGWSRIYIERSSKGKLVNVGNCDSDGVNVNNDNPDNSNSNLGVRFSRSVQRGLLSGAFRVCIFDPTAEHFADFKQFILCFDVPSFLHGLEIECQTAEEFHHSYFEVSLPEDQQFAHTCFVTGEHDEFEEFQGLFFDLYAKAKSVFLREDAYAFVQICV